MSSVAHSPLEQGQPVSVRSRQQVVNDVRPSTLPPPALKPTFHGPQHLLTPSSVGDDGLGEELQVTWEIEPGARVVEKVALPEPAGFDPPDTLDAFLDAVRWGAASTADVKNIQAPFRSGIDIEDDSPRLFTFEGPPAELRATANELAQVVGFVIAQNMQVPASSVIRSLFEAEGERGAACREDLGDRSGSKGKRLEGRAVAVEARKLAARVIAIVQRVEPVRRKRQRPRVKGSFEE
jgi:hypothetical protein